VSIENKEKYPPNSTDNIQIFDLINADTNLYRNNYNYAGKVLVAGALGYPMTIGDFNSNGKPDYVGGYKISVNLNISDCAIAELLDDSSFVIQQIYTDSVVIPLAATDVDNNQIKEINLRKAGGQFFYNYKSENSNSYPDSLNFNYRTWQMGGSIGSETFADMDNDGITDVIYKGDDLEEPSGTKLYVAEYCAEVNNFVKRFSYRPDPFRVSGFSVGDFDQDGYKEFVTGSIDGDIFVFENTGDDSYEFIFSDTISTPNAYLTCATNDIDKNGKIEFFVGGSSYYNGIGGTKVYWFESNSDNNYLKKYSFFLAGTDVLGTTELYSYDINADQIDDLVFAFSGAVVILTWNQQGYFELFYLNWVEDWEKEVHSVNIYDTFGDGRPDLYVSYNDYYKAPAIFSDFYLNNFITSIKQPQVKIPEKFWLYQNFPNPFNSATNIQFYIPQSDNISITIYDVTGKEVIKLLNSELMNPGEHALTWNGKNKFRKEVSSGVYLYQLVSTNYTQSKKMIVLR
jgi:hypothetical protein